MSKRTMTFDLTEREADVLNKLCERKGLSKTDLMREALCTYHAIYILRRRGDNSVLVCWKAEEKSDQQIP